jgi:hypothetical protein
MRHPAHRNVSQGKIRITSTGELVRGDSEPTLFARTLSDDYESDAAWEAVTALQGLGSRKVFEQAAKWCNSQEPIKRARGADILAQIGKTAEHPSNSFPDESFNVVSDI